MHEPEEKGAGQSVGPPRADCILELGHAYATLEDDGAQTPVGQRGLELHFSGGYSGTGADTMRNFCEYLRVARLSNGMFDVINA